MRLGGTIFAGTAHPALAAAIARSMGGPVGACVVDRFPEGAGAVRRLEPVRRPEVFLVPPTSPPVNDPLIEGLARAEACRRAAAAPITAMVPDVGYARADQRQGRRAPSRGRVVADLLQTVGRAPRVMRAWHTPQEGEETRGNHGPFVIAAQRVSDSRPRSPRTPTVQTGSCSLCRAVACPAPMKGRVRKLGVPGHEELARDTVATGGVRVLNEPVVEGRRLPDAVIDEVTTQAQPELTRRERLDRGGRPPADVRGRTIILVDDGLATGATRHAAINALRPQPPARIIVAVPTAAPDPGDALRAEVDQGICAITPAPCQAVGLWAEDCSPTIDDEVRDLLARRAPPEARHATPRTTDTRLMAARRQTVHARTGAPQDSAPLLALVGEARRCGRPRRPPASGAPGVRVTA